MLNFGFDPPLPEFPRDRYQVLDLLGEGGMGKVYKARDRHLNRYVALKFIRREDPVLARRLVLEAQFQAGIDHPNIRKVFEVGLLESVPCIAMEYISGTDLKVASENLGLQDRVALVAQAARAIHAAHQQGFVHRDLKPQNILVEAGEDGVLKAIVMDFGLARPVQATNLTLTDTLVGSPFYMPPEQIIGGGPMDARSDVYSLGATLYAICTGKPPYSIASVSSNSRATSISASVLKDESNPMVSATRERQPHVVEALRRVLDENPIHPRVLEPTLPRDLETIILKCLEKEPVRRFASARHLAEDLERFIRGEAILAQRGSLAYRMVKSYRRNRTLFWVAGGALLLLMALGAQGLEAARRSQRQADLAQRFGAEAQQLGQYLRLAHMSPLHDRRPLVAWLRQRMKEIEDETKAIGSLAEAPGAYALGQGFLALEEPEKAKSFLDKAWALGFRTAPVAEALGEVNLQLYLKGLDRIREFSERERKAHQIQLAATFRDPAIQFLRQAAGFPGMEAFRAAELTFLENQEDETIKQSQLTLKATPWMYEVLTLEAWMWGQKARRAEDEVSRNAFSDKAIACYEEAVRRAPTDPLIRADLASWLAWSAVRAPLAPSAPTIMARAWDEADRALVADRDFLRAKVVRAELHWAQARLGRPLGAAMEAGSLDKAVEVMESLAITHSDNANHLRDTLRMMVVKMENQRKLRQIQPELLQRARRLTDRLLALEPTEPRNHILVAELDYEEATDLETVGGDGRSAHRRAVERLEKAMATLGNQGILNRAHLTSLFYLGLATQLQGAHQEAMGPMDRGLDLFRQLMPVLGDQSLNVNGVLDVIGARMDWDYMTGAAPEATHRKLVELVEGLQSLSPNSVWLRMERARLDLLLGRGLEALGKDPGSALAAARERFKPMLNHPNPNARPYGNLAQCLLVEVKHRLRSGLDATSLVKEGLALAGKAIDAFPNHTRAKGLRGAFMILGLGDRKGGEARKIAKQALELLRIGAQTSHALRKDLSPYIQQAERILASTP